MLKENNTNEEAITTFQKIKRIFHRDDETGAFNPKLNLITQCIFAGSITGFLLGGRIGGRIGAVSHIESTKLAVYKSVAHAQREYQSKVIVGFVQNGCKFGWRAGVFSGIYSFMMVALSEVNPQYKNTNFVAAGACTGIVYKALAGWKSMVVGAVVGGGLSVPVALLTSAVNYVAPDHMKEKLDVFGTGVVLIPNIPNEEENIVQSVKDEKPLDLDDIIGQLEENLQEEQNAKTT